MKILMILCCFLTLNIHYVSASSGTKMTAEESRVKGHLTLVHELLSVRKVEGLNSTQKANRSKYLDYLKEYIEKGDFPQNIYHKDQRRPYFIDHRGVACAVGYLIIRSGDQKLAEFISENQNYEYLENIKAPGLEKWVENSGFKLEELQLIKPHYHHTMPKRSFMAMSKTPFFLVRNLLFPLKKVSDEMNTFSLIEFIFKYIFLFGGGIIFAFRKKILMRSKIIRTWHQEKKRRLFLYILPFFLNYIWLTPKGYFEFFFVLNFIVFYIVWQLLKQKVITKKGIFIFVGETILYTVILTTIAWNKFHLKWKLMDFLMPPVSYSYSIRASDAYSFGVALMVDPSKMYYPYSEVLSKEEMRTPGSLVEELK